VNLSKVTLEKAAQGLNLGKVRRILDGKARAKQLTNPVLPGSLLLDPAASLTRHGAILPLSVLTPLARTSRTTAHALALAALA
jgi:hypothetical protein